MADIFRLFERSMAMNDDVWLRHANPWSGITRFLALPMLAFAIWSRVWLGWGALVLLVITVLWIWLNPRLFAKPARFDHWMSRVVLGEYVFLRNRDQIADHHLRAANILAWLSVPGIVIFGWGLWALWLDWVLMGMGLAILPKVWFCDRMVWILADWEAEGRSAPGAGT